MPRIFTVEEIRSASSDSVVECFRGKIIWISKFVDASQSKRQNAQNFQAIELEEAGPKKGRIKALLRGRDEIPAAWKGKHVIITANHGSRGWTGVLAKDSDDKDKDGNPVTNRVLWITGTANIVTGSDVTNASADEHPEARSERKPAARSRSASGASDNAIANVEEFMRQCGRNVNASFMIFRSIGRLQEVMDQEGMELPPDMVEKIHATFFIRLDKMGLIGTLPACDVRPIIEERAARKAAIGGSQANTKAKEEEERKRKEAEEEERRKREEEKQTEQGPGEGSTDDWNDDVPF